MPVLTQMGLEKERLAAAVLLGACLALACPSAVLGAHSFYVSPTGKDAQSGASESLPLQWIQTAIGKSKPGDTIFLMPGTHTVKPGDNNITFSGKKGTAAAPITLTTTGPGVVVDLSAADTGWGGFRISDGSEWIVVDGGGTPNPFDENSYHLTLLNAAYQAATGNERSDIVCRPVTIQQASHITIRNLFGKRSMGGMGIYFKLLGRQEEGLFAGADETGIRIEVKGNTLPLRWKDVGDAELARIALAGCTNDAEGLYHAGLLSAALKLESLYDKLLTRLIEVNPARAMSLDDVRNGR